MNLSALKNNCGMVLIEASSHKVEGIEQFIKRQLFAVLTFCAKIN